MYFDDPQWVTALQEYGRISTMQASADLIASGLSALEMALQKGLPQRWGPLLYYIGESEILRNNIFSGFINFTEAAEILPEEDYRYQELQSIITPFKDLIIDALELEWDP